MFHKKCFQGIDVQELGPGHYRLALNGTSVDYWPYSKKRTMFFQPKGRASVRKQWVDWPEVCDFLRNQVGELPQKTSKRGASEKVKAGWKAHKKHGYDRAPDVTLDGLRIWYVRPNVCRTVGKHYVEANT